MEKVVSIFISDGLSAAIVGIAILLVRRQYSRLAFV
jgi:hypothetical protein